MKLKSCNHLVQDEAKAAGGYITPGPLKIFDPYKSYQHLKAQSIAKVSYQFWLETVLV